MNAKRLVILVALMMLVLSTLACGGGGGDGDAPEATTAPDSVELVPLLEAVDAALDNDCPSQAYCTTNDVNCKLGLDGCSETGAAACEACKAE